MNEPNKSIYYYEISLALSGVWKTNLYSYESFKKLKTGTVVLCQFGPKEILGIVDQEVSKPEFATKPVKLVTEFKLSDQVQKLHNWLQNYYPGVPGQNTQHFLPSFLKKLALDNEKESLNSKTAQLPPLTGVQTKAIQEIADHPTSSIVLHGITGSGKTRLYMELIAPQIASGKDVLLLYPEISLTSQLKKTLVTYFGKSKVYVYNSKRTPKEQRATWLASYSSSATSDSGRIFIGPRSALFLPHSNLGLIVIDEAHDGAYKQDSGSRYSGLLVAAALANFHRAQIIYGSATPPTSETQQILNKQGRLVCMHETALTAELRGKDLEAGSIKNNKDHKIGDVSTKAVDENSKTQFLTVDMTDKNKNSSQNYLLSKPLLDQIKQTLDNKKQSLIFLNRRGTARLLLCENCGWHASCPKCDMPLTYHHDNHQMRCHVCGHKDKTPSACPDCKHTLTQKTAGIKSIEEELKRQFPQARIARFDSDNNKADSFSERYQEVADGKVDIVLGTQLITKGLDLPLLETVGVLQADSALMLPDYTSEERSFQQLTQVAGRVGRGHDNSVANVIFQTYSPNSHIIAYATEQDWHGFYEQELRARESAHYPPYQYLMKIWVQKKSQQASEKAISTIAEKLHSESSIRILGPAPSFYEKSAGLYSWQIIVTSSNRKKLSELVIDLPKDTFFDLDPVSLL